MSLTGPLIGRILCIKDNIPDNVAACTTESNDATVDSIGDWEDLGIKQVESLKYP